MDENLCNARREVLVHHYGMAALRLTAMRNNGGFVVSSPGKNGMDAVWIPATRNPSGIRSYTNRIVLPLTEYFVLFPLGQRDTQQRNQSRPEAFLELFDRSLLKRLRDSRVETLQWNAGELQESSPDFLMPEEKIEHVARVSATLTPKCPVPEDEPIHRFFAGSS